MLKTLAPKFHHHISVRLRDIAEKKVTVNLEPIVIALEPRAKTERVAREETKSMVHDFGVLGL